ncbi:MAG: hypothetical protein HY751_01540 [Nitrospinae bacterium]|nr:hypothetical protein [Nitrospinota bacterium]
MAQEKSPDQQKPISFWQVFLDDIFLLFFLGVAITFISYTVWGLVELGTVGFTQAVN